MPVSRVQTVFPWRFILLLLAAITLPVVLALISPPALDWNALNEPLSQERFVFWQLRLPRHLLAFLVGASLSIAGASFQSLLKNPLADPYILGVSGGAALGYVLGVITGLPFFLLPPAGFLAALISLAFIYRLARTGGTLNTVNLLLTGVMFNSFSFALILLVNAIASFGQSQQILNLLLGAIEPTGWPQLALFAVLTVFAFLLLYWRSATLNLLCLGDEEALHLGVNVTREKIFVFVATSLLVGAAVSLCGLIGFVGLFVPHLLRLAFGADHRTLIPLCFVAGGIFLMISDFAAGHLLSDAAFQTRLPVGVITALIGAPCFVWLLKKQASGGRA